MCGDRQENRREGRNTSKATDRETDAKTDRKPGMGGAGQVNTQGESPEDIWEEKSRQPRRQAERLT